MRDKYWLAGHFYEVTTSAAVKRCRVAMLDYLQPGEKCLFAGVGHGGDAIYAAQRGAEVTVVDMSQTMLGKFQHNLDTLQQTNETPLAVTQVQRDILEVADYAQYDMVVARGCRRRLWAWIVQEGRRRGLRCSAAQRRPESCPEAHS